MLKKDLGLKILIISVFVYSNIVLSVSKYRHKKFEPRIVGGEPVPLEKYPFAVQFFNLGSLCGGVIINSWSVLTSGHCLVNNQDIEEMRVQVGSKYIYDFNAKRHELDYFVVHENYNKIIPFENDIAILFVKHPIEFNAVAKKGILVNHKKWMHPKEKNFIVTGWGWQEYGGELSELTLMKASLRYVSLEECSRLHQIKLAGDMFCLYGDGNQDTCRGDSGGGVLWHGRLVGLTSHGDGCAKKDKPSVYTNLWSQRRWIRNQLKKFIKNYCSKRGQFLRYGVNITI